jgi:outer membrane receptor protein involved in Fe transport
MNSRLKGLTTTLAMPVILSVHAAWAEPEYRTVVPESAAGFQQPGQRVRVPATTPSGGVPVDAIEVIDGQPGVLLQRTNRGAGAPVVRGFIGIDNQVTLDGVRLNLAIWRTGPLQYAALFDPLMMETVDVLSGPSGVRHGAGAVGGVVAFRSWTPLLGGADSADSFGGRVQIGADGADGTLIGHGRVRYDIGDVGGWAAVSGRTAGDLRHGGGSSLPGAYSQVHWSTRHRVRLGKTWRLTGALFGSQTDDAPRVDGLPRGTMRYSDNLEQLAYVGLEHRAELGDPTVLRGLSAVASLRHMREDESQLRCERDASGRVANLVACGRGEEAVVTGRSRWVDSVIAAALDVEAELALMSGRLSLTPLGGLRGEWVGSARPDEPDAASRFSDGSRYLSAHGGLWLDARLAEGGPDAWSVVIDGGVRVESMQALAPDVPGIGRVELGFTGLGGAVRAAATWDETVALWVSWNRGFRAPNLQEATVLGDTGQTFEIPNPNLGPQVADSLELGLRLRGERLGVSLVAFATTIDDAITRVPAMIDGSPTVDGKEVGQRINAERARHEGFEVSGTWTPGAGLAFALAMSWLDGSVTGVDGEDDVVRRLPPWNGRLDASWRSSDGRWRAGTSLRFAGPQRRLAPGDRTDIRICGDRAVPGQIADPCPGTDGWVDVRLSGAFRPRPELELTLQLDNVLDRRYRMHGSGLDAPGFNARLGARMDF